MSWMRTLSECQVHNNCTVHATVPHNERGYANDIPTHVEHRTNQTEALLEA